VPKLYDLHDFNDKIAASKNILLIKHVETK